MGQKISVLVVEDEALIRMDMVDFLQREGFEVFEAAHSAAAIEILERAPSIGIIFTDFDMGGSQRHQDGEGSRPFHSSRRFRAGAISACID